MNMNGATTKILTHVLIKFDTFGVLLKFVDMFQYFTKLKIILYKAHFAGKNHGIKLLYICNLIISLV